MSYYGKYEVDVVGIGVLCFEIKRCKQVYKKCWTLREIQCGDVNCKDSSDEYTLALSYFPSLNYYYSTVENLSSQATHYCTRYDY